MPKEKPWKYVKPKKEFNFSEYLVLPENKTVKITIKNWNYDAVSQRGTIFRTDVIKIDGKETERRLVIKNYENIIQLKKALSKKKSIRSTADLKITRKYNEDEMDYYFKMEFLKD